MSRCVCGRMIAEVGTINDRHWLHVEEPWNRASTEETPPPCTSYEPHAECRIKNLNGPWRCWRASTEATERHEWACLNCGANVTVKCDRPPRTEATERPDLRAALRELEAAMPGMPVADYAVIPMVTLNRVLAALTGASGEAVSSPFEPHEAEYVDDGAAGYLACRCGYGHVIGEDALADHIHDARVAGAAPEDKNSSTQDD
jgi:hypothetical protein